MAIFIVVIILVIIVFFFLNASKNHMKYEIQKEGGLDLIFLNLDIALSMLDFSLYKDDISEIEYHNRVNSYTFYKLLLKKTFDSNSPYQMQMSYLINGKVIKKTMPYIIKPYLPIEVYEKVVDRMFDELK